MFFVRRFACILALATILFASLSAQTPQPSPTQATQQQKQKPQPKCTDNGTYSVGCCGNVLSPIEFCTCSLGSESGGLSLQF
jgi:hypothetical protein